MSDGTPIEWTDATWPIVAGCEKESPGCKNCWAIRDSWRLAHNPNPKVSVVYKGTVHKVGSQLAWTGMVRPLPERLAWPLHWRKPRKIFVCSQSDLFHPKVPFDFIDQAFAVMAMCPRHKFQVLTKHPDRMLEYFSDPSRAAAIGGAQFEMASANLRMVVEGYTGLVHTRLPLKNVWLGFSAENQKYFDLRWPQIKDLAYTGWLVWASLEPLIGPINLGQAFTLITRDKYARETLLKWVVAGGESGPKARPSHPDWFRSLRDQCAAAGVLFGGVPFLFKQWGAWAPPIAEDGVPPGAVEERMYQVGKKAAGRTLDGIEHTAFPS